MKSVLAADAGELSIVVRAPFRRGGGRTAFVT
jgi:hypothetical protein